MVRATSGQRGSEEAPHGGVIPTPVMILTTVASGGKVSDDRGSPAVALLRHCTHAGTVAHVAAAVERRVAVVNLLEPGRFRHAQAMALPHDWREVVADDKVVAGVLAPPNVAQRAVLVVVAVDPLETAVVEMGRSGAGPASSPGASGAASRGRAGTRLRSAGWTGGRRRG